MAQKKSQQTTDEIREPGEKLTDEILNDPTISGGLKEDKAYTHLNANVIKDKYGKIPDIPEQEQTPITVDFSKDNTKDSSGFFSDPEDSGSSPKRTEAEPEPKSDLADSSKAQMAEFASEALFVVTGLANDIIMTKWVITEDKLKEMAISGEVSFEVVDIKVQFPGNFIFDMNEFLSKQAAKVKESLEFTRDEKKEINKLLAEIFKSKKFEMSPGESLAYFLALHYGTATYQLFVTNAETRKWLSIISATLEEAKNVRVGKSPSKVKEKPAPTVDDPTVETVNEVTDTETGNEVLTAEGTAGEIREPGESNNKGKNGRKPKRSANLTPIEDAIVTQN